MLSTKLSADTLATASDLPERLATTMAGACARTACMPIAPELSYGRHAGPAPASALRAAVMILLIQRGGQWHIPLTARPVALSRHGGQISLPGGTIDAGESSDGAAIRELREELGVVECVHLIGALADSYVYVSNYVVTPWVASIDSEPVWQPNAAEVEEVIEIPLAALVDPDSICQTTIRRGPLVFRAPCYQIGGHYIWGATNVILSELATVLRKLMVSSPSRDTEQRNEHE